MLKIKLIFTVLALSLVLTGCSDRTQINTFDYSHKQPVDFQSTGTDSELRDVLEGILENYDRIERGE